KARVKASKNGGRSRPPLAVGWGAVKLGMVPGAGLLSEVWVAEVPNIPVGVSGPVTADCGMNSAVSMPACRGLAPNAVEMIWLTLPGREATEGMPTFPVLGSVVVDAWARTRLAS